MCTDKAKKIFPAYFANTVLPSCAKEQIINVYRACRTGKLEPMSFLNTYEENGGQIPPDLDSSDPQVYCMSSYCKLRDVARFVKIDSRFQPPWLLAKGHTTCEDGKSCMSKEWKKGYNGSHVDWWLYEGAQPWFVFEEVNYEEERKRVSGGELPSADSV